MQAEDVVEQELAAQHRRRAIGIRRRRQQRALREQAAALVFVGQRHAPEPAAVDAGDPVVARKPLVDERVVGVQQLEDAAILAQRAGDKQLGFALERRPSASVVVRIALRIDDDLVDATQVQPLRGEIVDQRLVDRGSASIRLTCCSRTAGSLSFRCSASVSS